MVCIIYKYAYILLYIHVVIIVYTYDRAWNMPCTRIINSGTERKSLDIRKALVTRILKPKMARQRNFHEHRGEKRDVSPCFRFVSEAFRS